MIWTDEAVEELKKMWDKGMTTGQIAKVLNVTKNSIIGKVHRLCLTARPSPIKKSSGNSAEKKASKPQKAEKVEKATKTSNKVVKEVPVSPISENTKNTTPVVEETNIPLVKLDNHTCRWPMGDPKDEDFCFCGKRIRTGQTYCEEHAAVAYVKAGKKI
ncbi:MAG: global cell cycle regulator GcrA-like protein [Alphaproteobacteria bacterium]|nr:global cell cycle regulator GcrA-like protein [Alphaproteobacteria bacterium]